MKRFGDRRDGKKVRNLTGTSTLICDLKPNRCDADVYINEKIDVTDLLEYIKKKNEDNPDKKYTVFHAFSHAIAKVVYNRPLMNRFIANRTFYDRNEIKLAFVAKVKFEDLSKELLAVIPVKNNYTIDDMQDIISKKVSNIRSNTSSDTNDIVDIVASLPKIIRVAIMGIIKWLDKHGWLPDSFTNDNIYYSTVIMSNLGSIKCGAIYHNLANFGTSSVLVTMGEIHKEKVFINEKEKVRDICEFGVNLDERIGDGLYFAKSVKLLKYILQNPEMLEDSVDEKVELPAGK